MAIFAVPSGNISFSLALPKSNSLRFILVPNMVSFRIYHDSWDCIRLVLVAWILGDWAGNVRAQTWLLVYLQAPANEFPLNLVRTPSTMI